MDEVKQNAGGTAMFILPNRVITFPQNAEPVKLRGRILGVKYFLKLRVKS